MTHEVRWSKNTSWVTPKWVFDWLGRFDLDPATFDGHPWPCATENWSTGGLDRAWNGRVFLNPPFCSGQIEPFVKKMAEHRNGVLVCAARVETNWFQDYVFGSANAIWFPRGRIKYSLPDGRTPKAVAFPSCVVFYEQPRPEPNCGTWWYRSRMQWP
jgi:hypothetical protein